MSEDARARLAQAPIEALVRAEEHRQRVEILIAMRGVGADDTVPRPVAVAEILCPAKTYRELVAIARNIARRLNRDGLPLPLEEMSP